MTMAERLLSELVGGEQDWNRLLGGTRAGSGGQGFLPPADIYETEHEYVVEIDAPGLHSENLSVEMVDGQLVVAGEREQHQDVHRFFRRERWGGRFVRTFQLGQAFRSGDIKAEYDDGVLVIRLPKPEETKPKKITIGSGQKQIKS